MRLLTTLIIIAVSSPALAHTGQATHSLTAGLAHPFGGADHLLAMLAVGLWAALATGPSWLAPVGFLTGVAAGGAAGFGGSASNGIEIVAVVSPVVLGGLAAFATRAPAAAAFVVAAAFGAAHGAAHGAEAPSDAGATAYLTGALIATAALHAVGAATGVALSSGRARIAGRALGALVALAGGVFALT
jgi:urease accessory protein